MAEIIRNRVKVVLHPLDITKLDIMKCNSIFPVIVMNYFGK